MFLDDVAVDFPDMPIIMAHPSFPWQDEALVGGRPQGAGVHRPVGLVAEVLPARSWCSTPTRCCARRCCSASDFPLFTPERWLADLEKTEIRDTVKPDIMLHNAARLFGIS